MEVRHTCLPLCQHDCGHAFAALSYAAAALGWPVRLLTVWGDAQIAALTGVDREADFPAAEPEAPEVVVWVGPGEPPGAQSVLDMLARFDDIAADKPWRYRQRFWEAGILGQVLYLEAEAAGVQGTGIGCYFDDAAHQALGLQTRRFQDIYHFTVGTALVDTRLVSEPAYAHRSGGTDRRSPATT